MAAYKSDSTAVTNPPSSMHNMLFSAAWLVCGVLTVLVPLVYRTMKMNNYQNLFEMYNWEEVQQQYQENQNQYENNYMQQYGEGNYRYQWEQMRGSYDINHCKWYQFNCFPYYINEKGEPEPSAGWYPAWFSGWTITEEEREEMMENGVASSALKFTYVWQIMMFVVILAYGYKVIKQNRVVTGVTVALVLFTNMCFLGMWMLADGSIVTDGEYVQKTGFYGQFAVLMFITNAWYVIFGIVFSVMFVIRGYFMQTKPDETKPEEQDGAAQSYKALESPPSSPDRKPVLV